MEFDQSNLRTFILYLLYAFSILFTFFGCRKRLKGFPGRPKIEFTILLGELEGFLNDALLLSVPAYLDKAGEGKVLPQRMPFKPIIRQDSPQVRMSLETDAVHVPYFPLGPISRGEDVGNGGHRIEVGNGKLQLETEAVGVAEEAVGQVEAIRWIGGSVSGSQFYQLLETGSVVVTKEHT